MRSASPFELDHHIFMSLTDTELPRSSSDINPRSSSYINPRSFSDKRSPRIKEQEILLDLGLCSRSRSANELRNHDTDLLQLRNFFQPIEVINNRMPVKVSKLTSESAGSEMLIASQVMDSGDSMAKLPAVQPPREQFICPYPEAREEILMRGQLLYTVKYFCCM